MKVRLVGLGCGTGASVTAEGGRALLEAELIVGAQRLLDELDGTYCGLRAAAVKPEEILRVLSTARVETAAVVYSGDTGFYSGARRLLPLLEKAGVNTAVIPGISSLQWFSARLKRPWQDWFLCTAHGVSCDAVHAVMQGKPAFFLTGGAQGPGALCRQLADAGLGTLAVTVGENLSYEDERISAGTAAEFADAAFAPLAVMLAEAAPRYPGRTPGIPDGEFIRGQVPMTKQEVRCAILGKLAVTPGDECWDIGAGTGSVSVELAAQARQVWAVERYGDACALIRENRRKFCAWNLHVLEGTAPEALEGLPRPDKVFVGGTGGRLRDILEAVRRANPEAAVCVSAIALETLQETVKVLPELGYDVDVTQIAVSRAKAAGSLHLMMAQNPVWLITGVQA